MLWIFSIEVLKAVAPWKKLTVHRQSEQTASSQQGTKTQKQIHTVHSRSCNTLQAELVHLVKYII